MKKFEYIILGHEPGVDKLNILGTNGWELCVISDYGIWYFKREISDIDYARLLISCSYMRNVSNLQHRTIAEFAQFVEDVMSHRPGCEKYDFDINRKDAIEIWIQMFHNHCKEYYSKISVDEENKEL